MLTKSIVIIYIFFRGVARGGAEGARAPPEFGRSVNPIQTRGGRLCPSHYCQPPRIQKAIYISELPILQQTIHFILLTTFYSKVDSTLFQIGRSNFHHHDS